LISDLYQHPPETRAKNRFLCSRSRSDGIVPESALLLLVLGVFADNHDAAFAFDDLAFFANGFHTRSYFHGGSPFASYRQKIIFSKSFSFASYKRLGRVACSSNRLFSKSVLAAPGDAPA
jgi:hypothetical protein